MSDWLDAIEARANAATEGPWWSDPWAQGDVFSGAGLSDDPMIVGDGLTAADLEFIAASRTDVPALVDYARKLEAMLANGGANES